MVTIENSNGLISITSEVFSNIAGEVATRCFGVKGMAGKAKSDGLYQLLRRENMSKGVEVTFSESGSIAISLHIVVDHGVNLATLARSIISEVTYKVNSATGVPVERVDVYVDSMLIN